MWRRVSLPVSQQLLVAASDLQQDGSKSPNISKCEFGFVDSSSNCHVDFLALRIGALMRTEWGRDKPLRCKEIFDILSKSATLESGGLLKSFPIRT